MEEIVTKISNSPEETIKLGEDLARNFNPGDVVALYGKLGAGKTTFVQGVCKTLDTETPSSPSYVIINQYQGKHVVYHIDLYRISSDEELHDLGLEEYLYGNGITLMEWAEKARSVLPERRIEIYFEVTNEHSRELKIVNYN